jgi:uncharacterized repeat protein (TIGR01451 family)
MTPPRDRFGAVLGSVGVSATIAAAGAPFWGPLPALAAGAITLALLLFGYTRFYDDIERIVASLEKSGPSGRSRRRAQRRRLPRRNTVILAILSSVVGATAGIIGVLTTINASPTPKASPPTAPFRPARPGAVLADSSGLKVAMGVENTTRGDKQYSKSVVASYDDVVAVELWYGNFSPDGHTIDHVAVGIELPATEAGDALVRGVVHVAGRELRPTATIDLDRPDARLSFIDGSIVWRRNTASPSDDSRYENISLPDSRLIGNPQPLDNVRAGPNYEATLSLLLRVQVPSIGIAVKVRATAGEFETRDVSRAGASVRFAVRVSNLGNVPLTNVQLWGALPPQLHIKPDEAISLGDGERPPVSRLRAAFTEQVPIDLGTIDVGASRTIEFDATVDPEAGGERLVTRAVVTCVPTGTYNNFATLDIAT